MFNFFGGKKSDSYYLELKENEGSQPDTKAEAPVQPVEAQKAEMKPVAPTEKAKKTSGKKTAKKEVTVAAPKPKAPPTPEELIKAAVATSSNGTSELQETGFASKYLITDTMSRRRPGPSLNIFKDMARQVNPKG